MRLSTRYNELAISLALSISFNLYDMIFVLISFPLLPILSIPFLLELKRLFFSLFSPRDLNCLSNSFTSSFMIK